MSKKMILECQKLIGASLKGSKEFYKNKQLITAVINSLQAVQFFEDEKIYSCLEKLF